MNQVRDTTKKKSCQHLNEAERKIIERQLMPGTPKKQIARMRLALRQKGIFKSHGTVRAAMRESGFLHKARRPHGITKATTEVQERENLIKRDFSAEAPLKNQQNYCEFCKA